MPLPQIAIVGRPNVGKSTLFNKICGKRLSIVYDQDGVTRDRIYSQASFLSHNLMVIDTGGFLLDYESDCLYKHVLEQVNVAIQQANVIIMVVDGRCGPCPSDTDIANMLRQSRKPTVLAVNKLESHKFQHEIHQFHSLGISSMFAISAEHGDGVFDLLSCCCDQLPQQEDDELSAPRHPTFCIVGRPNVGKSTFINCITGSNRSLVNNEPGTTTDCIESTIKVDETTVKIVDTAGINKSKNINDFLTKICLIKTHQAIRRSSIAILIIDATVGPKTLEKKIASLVQNEYRGCVIFLNKWDLIKNNRMEHSKLALIEEIRGDFPIVVGSAISGRNVQAAIKSALVLHQKFTSRITTGELNRAVASIIKKFPPPIVKGKTFKIYYVTQASSGPPTFVFFVNNKKFLDRNWSIFLKNSLTKELCLQGVPLRLFFRSKVEVS